MKHTRPIVLEPWQATIVDEHAGSFVRGLFHPDGRRSVNRTPKRMVDGMRRSEYPRYMFSNKSDDIPEMCEAALDRLDVGHRRPRWDLISVARREAATRLDEVVGPKH